MPRAFRGLSAALLLVLSLLLPAAGEARASGIMIMEAFARASATPTARSGAAYVSLMNHGDADRLTGASSPVAAHAEIHRTDMVDGVMKMQPAGALEIPAHGMLEMKPGGYHIMLMGLAGPLREGERIELTLTFEKAGNVKIDVPVGAVAAGSHDHGAASSGEPGG